MRNNCIYSFLSLIWTFNQTINERYVQKLETLLFSRVPLLGRRRAAVVTTLYQIWCDTRHGGDRGAAPTVAAMPAPWLGASKYFRDNPESGKHWSHWPTSVAMVTGGVTAISLFFANKAIFMRLLTQCHRVPVPELSKINGCHGINCATDRR